jgi:hypothetical protein
MKRKNNGRDGRVKVVGLRGANSNYINATSQVIRAILKNNVQKVTGSHAISTSIHMMQIAVIPITPIFFIAVFFSYQVLRTSKTPLLQ